MSIVWPPELPPLQNEGTRYAPEPAAARFAPDDGRDKLRRRTTRARRSFTTPLELTGAQLQVFLAFLDESLDGGAAPFEWTDPVTDGAVVCRLRREPEWTLRTAAPAALRRWTADLDVEILPEAVP